MLLTYCCGRRSNDRWLESGWPFRRPMIVFMNSLAKATCSSIGSQSTVFIVVFAASRTIPFFASTSWDSVCLLNDSLQIDRLHTDCYIDCRPTVYNLNQLDSWTNSFDSCCCFGSTVCSNRHHYWTRSYGACGFSYSHRPICKHVYSLCLSNLAWRLAGRDICCWSVRFICTNSKAFSITDHLILFG